ncbi:hypothetical protein [Salinarimonas sp.]|uniref:hypothetical protein n=1 Tax=Salinarimonas sp. TaxID=2766526 RepID=UPI00391931E9
MIRFFVRVLGLLLVAAGFVGIVVDGTRSIANHEIAFTPLGQVLFTLFPQSFPMLEPAVTRYVSPVLWDPVLLTILLWPASIVSFVIGALLIWAGQRPREEVGYLTDK